MKGDAEDRTLTEMERRAVKLWDRRGGAGDLAPVVWACNGSTDDQVHEINPSTLTLTRTASAPNTSPFGIGGKSNVIWNVDFDNDTAYELSVNDFSVINSAVIGAGNVLTGIGGTATTPWACDNTGTTDVFELREDVLSKIRTGNSPSGYVASGIGGDDDTIFLAAYKHSIIEHRIYELSTSDFSVVQSFQHLLSSGGAEGVGGSSSRMWLSSGGGPTNSTVFEKAVTPTFGTTIKQNTIVKALMYGCGGS